MSVRQRISKRRFLGSKQGLLFLVFAAVIWTLSALSETYITTVPVQLKFISDAENLVLSTSKMEVSARVSSTGFSVLYRRIFPREIRLSVRDLPIKNLENPVLNTAFLFGKYIQNYGSSNQISGFVQSSISLPVSPAIQKSFVPTLASFPEFESGFHLITPLKFSVDSVSAFGSKPVLEQLQKAVFTLPTQNPLRTNFSLEATLIDSIAQLAHWSATTIQVSGSVDRYSDVSFTLPITIENMPENLNLTIAPKQVEIKFAAPLSLLPNLDASSLSAVVLFDKSNLGQLTVKITGLPDVVKQLSILPPNVSYFIVE